MELTDLLRTLRRHWLSGVIAFSIVMLIGVGSLFLQDKRYEANATLVAVLEPDIVASNPLSVFTSVLPAFEARVESRTFGEDAQDTLPSDVADANVSISASSQPEAGILEIKASSKDKTVVEPWANAYADHALDELQTPLVTVDVLDPAIEPGAPAGSGRVGILLGTFALALIVGLLTPLAVNATLRRDNAAEIRSRFGMSVLGEIPSVGRFRQVAMHPAELFNGAGGPSILESFQSLRTNVELLVVSRHIEAITVSSLMPSEGKSTVAANLAWALASVGHNIVLVDGDLRAPSMHTILRVSMSDGVSAAASSDPATLARNTPIPNLKVIPAGIPTRHPAEIVGPSLAPILDHYAGHGRLVVVDSPPIEGAAEAMSIAAMTKWVILVIDARRRDFVDIERSILDLREHGGEILGVVINRSRVRRSKETERYYHFPIRRHHHTPVR
jgi:capsular exopolysaccharide synthesis family protein